MVFEPDYELLGDSILDTVIGASTELPGDVARALHEAYTDEPAGACKSALGHIVENIDLAKEKQTPICQDTGYPTFFVDIPPGWDKGRVTDLVHDALKTATQRAILRPNAVNPFTGKNSGDNIGEYYPAIYFQDVPGDTLELKLLLKGGGSENVSCQYKLPHTPLGAGRDLAGVEKVVLHGVLEAQGFGCGPGIIGIGIGGDRAQSYSIAKKQLLRPLDDRSTMPELAKLESAVKDKANALGIGAMGFGGRTTVLGVKAGWGHRHPASFFVTIAYGCWALRRKVLTFGPRGVSIADR